MKTKFYYLKGKEVHETEDVKIWAKQIENEAIIRVDQTLIEGTFFKPSPIRISTVFIGLDCTPWGDSPPLVFETMVFGGKLDQEQERYSTWDEATAGHDLMVRKVKAHL